MKLRYEFPSTSRAAEVRGTLLESVPTFLTDDGVSGRVLIEDADAFEALSHTMMEIRLLGFVKMSMIWADSSVAAANKKSLATSQKILDLVHRQPLGPSINAASESALSSSFHFPLHNSALKGLGMIDHRSPFDPLPSSLEERSSITSELRHSAPKTCIAVFYQIQAKLWHRNSVLGDKSQKINVFGCGNVAPPLCVRDFRPDYITKDCAPVRRKLLQKIGNMSIEASQPDPFIFDGGTGEATTSIILRVSLDTNQHCAWDPGNFEAAVTWRLQSATFVSSQKMERQPTVQEAEISRSMVSMIKTGASHNLKMSWSDWIPSLRNAASATSCTIWTAVHPIWLSVYHTHGATPTISHTYISRRHSLLIDVYVSGSGRSHLVLKVPVQVIYRSRTAELASSDDATTSCLHASPLQPHLSEELGHTDYTLPLYTV